MPLRLAQALGHLWFYPADAKTHGQLLLHTRRCLQAHQELPPEFAEQMLNVWLAVWVNQRLYKRLNTSTQILFHKLLLQQNYPLWLLRLYEYLFKLPEQTLLKSQKYPSDSKNNLSIETSAALCSSLFTIENTTLHPNNLLSQLKKKLAPFLEHARLHNQSVVPASEQWVMVVNKPIGMQLHPEDLKTKNTKASDALKSKPNQAKHPDSHPLSDFMSTKALSELLPEQKPKALLHQYYRELAWPHVLSLSHKHDPQAGKGTPENFDIWHVDEPIQKLNWAASLMRNPTLIPGLTTIKSTPASEIGQIEALPPCLHLYLDTSRSMKNPEKDVSLLVLSGFILMLSALRLDWRVRVVNWAETTRSTGLTHDEFLLGKALLTTPTGATRLPLELWCSQQLMPHDTHIILSDLGCLKALQSLEPLQHNELTQWARQHHVLCLLDLPLTEQQAENSFKNLSPLLPDWHFSKITRLEQLKHCVSKP